MRSGGKGNSRAQTTSESTTNNTQTTVNEVDNRVFDVGEGGQLVQGDGNYIVSTDHNAIGSATELARASVDAAESIARSGLELSTRQTENIVDFSRDTLRTNADLAGKALNSVGDAYHDASLTTSSLFDKALDYLGGLTGKTVTALNEISIEQNKSTDQRVAEVSENATKYTLIAITVIAVGATIAYAVRKS